MPSPISATDGFDMVSPIERNDAHEPIFRFLRTDRIAQRPSVAVGGDYHDIAVLQPNLISKTEVIRDEDVYMNIFRPPVSFKFKVVVRDVL